MFNKLKKEDLVELLDFSLDYFKKDINFKIENKQLEGIIINEIFIISKENEDFYLEGISINQIEILPVAYNKKAFESFSSSYEDVKFRELLTYLNIHGLHTIYETEYLKVEKGSSQHYRGWGSSFKNEDYEDYIGSKDEQ